MAARITARELIEKLQELTLDAHVDIEIVRPIADGGNYTVPLTDVFQMPSGRSAESDPSGILVVLSPDFRASDARDEANERGIASREEQHARYLDSGPGAWDDESRP